MIRPPARSGVAFSEKSDGDLRGDSLARADGCAKLDISTEWVTLRQVHGGDVVHRDTPGDAGEADAAWTTTPRLPLVIFTADCFGVVMHAPGAVGVAHAGWRGVDSGVVEHLRTEMTRAGHTPTRAEVGPGIGPCCFEVGPEVAVRFERHVRTATTWGTVSVDLRALVASQLEGIDTWSVVSCTQHDPGWFSHRGSGTSQRLGTIGWLQ